MAYLLLGSLAYIGSAQDRGHGSKSLMRPVFLRGGVVLAFTGNRLLKPG